MSDPSSPASNVPYLAYKSKRHSRNLSNSNSHLVPNQSPPPISKPPSSNGTALSSPQPQKLFLDVERDETEQASHGLIPLTLTFSSPLSDVTGTASLASVKDVTTVRPPLRTESAPILENKPSPVVQTSSQLLSPPATSPSTPTSESSAKAADNRFIPKKATTFRRVPRKSLGAAAAINPKSPQHARTTSSASLPPTTIPTLASTSSITPAASPSRREPIPLAIIATEQPKSPSPHSAPPAAPSPLTAPQLSIDSVSSSHRERPSEPPRQRNLSKPAPYPLGFQPKGAIRHLTDDFLQLRKAKRESGRDNAIARVERTKLERRLEKLIALHFPGGLESKTAIPERRPVQENRRLSSFFDFRTVNVSQASDLWRGAVTAGFDSAKIEVRKAEQRITPWEEDSAVSKCPFCLASFHALTNRKHHCRLCGRIVCSLPVKSPQRESPCSVLFVVDNRTREIEEVSEGVDYGVRKRRTSEITNGKGKQDDTDKFLRGVRICRDCSPVLQRMQYYQRTQTAPPFVRLYQDFISLEQAIEESLPEFQQLLMTLSHNDNPTREASAARKRLLDSFAQYDRLSKRILALPCANGPGSSQDRVQQAITSRANLFLQKNMFPLQSLPTPGARSGMSSTPGDSANGTDLSNALPDVDAQLAQSLQPLLEQEALLESFIEEAQAQRKFEDVKSLKLNLSEIRKEIEKLLNPT